ncbi:MAG: DNA polymerase IV [Dehalococcoidia bacterium]
MSRCIIHADLDAFFASVEQLDNPDLRGKPVVVGGPPEARGVVAAASYEARAYGIRSAMPMATALRLCPQAVRVSPRFQRYAEVSKRVMDIFRQVTPLVEQISLDEAFLDVSDRVGRGFSPEEVARMVKERVHQEVGLTVSVGVGSSKSVAKIASGLSKPDGLIVVPPGSERPFLGPLPVEKLWGVGPKTAERLAEDSIATIGDLAQKSEEWARSRFGARGLHFLNLARGIDDSPVVVEHERKSVSTEMTFPRDVHDPEALHVGLRKLANDTARRLQRAGWQGRTIKLKLRLADFTTFTRQTTISRPTNAAEVILAEASRLLARELRPGRRFRLLGVGVSNLSQGEANSQPSLFRLS